MKNKNGAWHLALLLTILFTATMSITATTIPISPPDEVVTLMVAKELPVDGTQLSWNDGSAPYIVIRSETPDFSSSITILYVSRNASSPTDDANVLLDTKNYFYQVYDLNAAPQIFSFSASDLVIGDTLTIDGAGFDPANIHIYLEGEEIPIQSATSSQCQLTVPAIAASGQLTVVSSSGVSQPRQLNKLYFKDHADLNHVSADSNHDVWVTERGTAVTSDKIYKINHTDGSVQSWGTLNECVGLPIDSAGNHYVGNSSIASSNKGTIWKVDSAGASTTWGNAGTATTDPVYIRALAIDPLFNNPSALTVYALDGNNSDHSSNIRAVTIGGHYTYLSIGATIPNPGGLAINSSQHMFYTLSSSIQEINSAKTFVFSYDSTFGISNPAQIDVESDTRLWIANKGANNILRISTDADDRKYLEKISGLNIPQGVAFDHDPTIDPVSGLSKSYVYVAEKTQFSRFRVYDTVWISIKVLNETIGNYGEYLPGMTKAELENFIMKDFELGKAILKQAGIELKLRGSIEWIADPNLSIEGHSPGWVSRHGTLPGLTTELQNLFQDSRSANVHDINIYYVLAALDIDPVVPIISTIFGETFTNDTVPSMDNETESGIIITRAGNDLEDPPQIVRRTHHSILAHEILHFLMDYPSVATEHDVPYSNYIMNIYDEPDRFTLGADHIDNVQNNSDESAFIERF